MNSLRKWLYRPKKTDASLLAQFFYADEELNTVASELDSFDGRKDPDRCTSLVNTLRQCQDKVLSLCQLLMDELIPEERAPRDFRAKFPDDVLQENLAGQLWFGAECLSAGSNILNREVESASMRPLAKALTKSLENVRNLLREQCFRNPPEFTEKILESLKILDRLFAEFELLYVSAMVPVKSVLEYEAQQGITVLFSETLQRALKLELLSQDQVDACDPALMFTIPRLAIVAGLLVYPEGPLDLEGAELSDMFRPFRSLLIKIRELLWTLGREELGGLERALCSEGEGEVNNREQYRNQQNQQTHRIFQQGSAIQDYLEQFYKDFPQCKDFVSEICPQQNNAQEEGGGCETENQAPEEEGGEGSSTPKYEGGLDEGSLSPLCPTSSSSKSCSPLGEGVESVKKEGEGVESLEGVGVFSSKCDISKELPTVSQSCSDDSGLGSIAVDDHKPTDDMEAATFTEPPSTSDKVPKSKTSQIITIVMNHARQMGQQQNLQTPPQTTTNGGEGGDSSSGCECGEDMEIALAMQAAEIASRNEVRARFKSSSDLIHRLFICISGVADQLQTNYAADLRSTLKCVFAINATPSEFDEGAEGSGDEEESGLEESELTPEPSLSGEVPFSSSQGQSFAALEEGEGVEVMAPPTWVPDELAPQCMACSAPFTVVRRRHHCRNCGKVFCGKCSGNSVALPRFGHLKPVRVCNRCFMYSVTPFTLPS